MYIHHENVDEALVESIVQAAQHPNAVEVFYHMFSAFDQNQAVSMSQLIGR